MLCNFLSRVLCGIVSGFGIVLDDLRMQGCLRGGARPSTPLLQPLNDKRLSNKRGTLPQALSPFSTWTPTIS